MFLGFAPWHPATATPASVSLQSVSTVQACPNVGSRKYVGLSSGTFEKDDTAERCAIDHAVANGLLGSGDFQIIHDRSESNRVVAEMKKRLRALGVNANFRRCDWIGLVSQGRADGTNSYGAACELSLNGQHPRPILICNSDLGGLTLLQPDAYASDASFIETFIRRACF